MEVVAKFVGDNSNLRVLDLKNNKVYLICLEDSWIFFWGGILESLFVFCCLYALCTVDA
jgi:hypothetical protein